MTENVSKRIRQNPYSIPSDYPQVAFRCFHAYCNSTILIEESLDGITGIKKEILRGFRITVLQFIFVTACKQIRIAFHISFFKICIFLSLVDLSLLSPLPLFCFLFFFFCKTMRQVYNNLLAVLKHDISASKHVLINNSK